MSERDSGPEHASHDRSHTPVGPHASTNTLPPWQKWLRNPDFRFLGLALGAIAIFAIGYALGSPTLAPESTSVGGAAEKTAYTCAMHPQIRRLEPGKCPLCEMKLVPVKGAGEGASTTVELTEDAKRLARIETSQVKRAHAAGEIRLLGRIEEDETGIRTIAPWISGRIDRLLVRETGQRIGQGQVIAKMYSPEVYAAHRDLIEAKKHLGAAKDSIDVARKAAETGLEAARDRLRLLGIPGADLAQMEKEKSPRTHVDVRSTYGGTIVERMVAEGVYVQAGTPLFRTTNLGRVWFQLDAYEGDLAHIEVGLPVHLTLEGFPGRTFDGKVAFIDPMVDTRARTARVRVALPNKDGKLRPGMFGEAVLESSGPMSDAPLVVPRSAPLFTGRRSVVYVEREDTDAPTYEAREVHLGPLMGEVYVVHAGLGEGERVVIQGAFALDSELQIRGGASMMARQSDEDVDDQAATPAPDARAGEPAGDDPKPPTKREPPGKSSLDSNEPAPSAHAQGAVPEASREASENSNARAEKFEVAWHETVSAYLTAEEALFQSNARAAKAAFARVSRAAGAASAIADDATVRGRLAKIQTHASHASRGDLEASRAMLDDLSNQLSAVMRARGNPTSSTVRIAFCPMANGKRGGTWLQRAPKIRNPYLGSTMPSCGSFRGTFKPRGRK